MERLVYRVIRFIIWLNRRIKVMKIGNMVFIAEPGLVDEVLRNPQKHYVKDGWLLRAIAAYIGKWSLFTTNDDEIWQLVHKIAQPFFAMTNVLASLPTTIRLWTAEMDSWDTSQPVDIYDRYTNFSVRLLLEQMFGFDERTDPGYVNDVVNAAYAVFEEMPKYIASNLVQRWVQRFDMKARRRFEAIVDDLIAKAKDNPSDDLIGRLVKAQRHDARITDEIIRDQVFGLLVAGFDSISSVFSIMIEELACDRSIFVKLKHGEVASVLQGQPPTAANLYRLEGVQTLVSQALSQHPAFPLFPLSVGTDTILGSTKLKAGTVVVIDLQAASDILSGNGQQPDGNFMREKHYLPFGTGQRVCPAKALSVHVMVATLAMLIQRADVITLTGGQPRAKRRYAMTMSSQAQVNIRWSSRQQASTQV